MRCCTAGGGGGKGGEALKPANSSAVFESLTREEQVELLKVTG